MRNVLLPEVGGGSCLPFGSSMSVEDIAGKLNLLEVVGSYDMITKLGNSSFEKYKKASVTLTLRSATSK